MSGPAAAPAGAVVVPAGNNSSVDFEQAGKTFSFAPGVHTLGTGEFDQIVPGDDSTYIGGPGAVLDGQGKNGYAFTERAPGVTIKDLDDQELRGPDERGHGQS